MKQKKRGIGRTEGHIRIYIHIQTDRYDSVLLPSFREDGTLKWSQERIVSIIIGVVSSFHETSGPERPGPVTRLGRRSSPILTFVGRGPFTVQYTSVNPKRPQTFYVQVPLKNCSLRFYTLSSLSREHGTSSSVISILHPPLTRLPPFLLNFRRLVCVPLMASLCRVRFSGNENPFVLHLSGSVLLSGPRILNPLNSHK